MPRISQFLVFEIWFFPHCHRVSHDAWKHRGYVEARTFNFHWKLSSRFQFLFLSAVKRQPRCTPFCSQGQSMIKFHLRARKKFRVCRSFLFFLFWLARFSFSQLQLLVSNDVGDGRNKDESDFLGMLISYAMFWSYLASA